jgi:poly-beta-1,6-N-acetyl-D-glucosamine synthase
VTATVGVVAGVLGIFRRDAVMGVGGYDPRMATEDIDLSWRLLIEGWETYYEPHALVGMQVPSTLRALWAQRKRWARGQGEVMRVHWRAVVRLRNRRIWLLLVEGILSLAWVVALVASLVLAIVNLLLGDPLEVLGFGLLWGVAIAVMATIQLAFALQIDLDNDRRAAAILLVGPIYPIAYWMIAAAAALRSESVALVRGPGRRDVSWDLPRESLEPQPRP